MKINSCKRVFIPISLQFLFKVITQITAIQIMTSYHTLFDSIIALERDGECLRPIDSANMEVTYDGLANNIDCCVGNRCR